MNDKNTIIKKRHKPRASSEFKQLMEAELSSTEMVYNQHPPGRGRKTKAVYSESTPVGRPVSSQTSTCSTKVIHTEIVYDHDVDLQ